MSCFCSCFSSQVSTLLNFQKQFIDDVQEKVQQVKESQDKREREMHQRSVQLHLDELEEKYLCCVCGRSGEAREDDEYIYTTYSIITMPSKKAIQKAMQEQILAKELEEQRSRQAHSSKGTSRHGTPIPAPLGADGKRHRKVVINDGNSTHALSRTSSGYAEKSRTVSRQASKYESEDSGSSSSTSSDDEDYSINEGEFDPNNVTALEVKQTMKKVRNVMLRKEDKIRRKAVAVHKDKGLMMIEDNEVETFSQFFQRPVHGYLCQQCHTCATRRLETLKSQIQAILFKGSHPLLRRVTRREVQLIASEGTHATALFSSILAVQQRWTDEQARLYRNRNLNRGNDDDLNFMESQSKGETQSFFFGDEKSLSNAYSPSTIAPSSSKQFTATCNALSGKSTSTEMKVLSDKSIFAIRDNILCNVCSRRPSSFFVRESVLFLCQFCCSRDRFYRDHAVCVNDEAMPIDYWHILTDLSRCHEQLSAQRNVRQVHDTVIEKASTDLFGWGVETDLFQRQPIVASLVDDTKETSNTSNAQKPKVMQLEAKPLFSSEPNAAAKVGETMVSLFSNIVVKPVVDLFASEEKGPLVMEKDSMQGGSKAAAPNFDDLFSNNPPPPAQNVVEDWFKSNNNAVQEEAAPAAYHQEQPASLSPQPYAAPPQPVQTEEKAEEVSSSPKSPSSEDRSLTLQATGTFRQEDHTHADPYNAQPHEEEPPTPLSPEQQDDNALFQPHAARQESDGLSNNPSYFLEEKAPEVPVATPPRSPPVAVEEGNYPSGEHSPYDLAPVSVEATPEAHVEDSYHHTSYSEAQPSPFEATPNPVVEEEETPAEISYAAEDHHDHHNISYDDTQPSPFEATPNPIPEESPVEESSHTPEAHVEGSYHFNTNSSNNRSYHDAQPSPFEATPNPVVEEGAFPQEATPAAHDSYHYQTPASSDFVSPADGHFFSSGAPTPHHQDPWSEQHETSHFSTGTPHSNVVSSPYEAPPAEDDDDDLR